MAKGNNRISKAFWLWCQFSKKDMIFLENLKLKVNELLLGPKFDIHLTLVGPYLKFDKEEKTLIKNIIKKQKKIDLNLLNYSYSNDKYTSLFIEVEKSNTLISLRNKFNETNYLNKNSNYNPHISLFYGIKKRHEKKTLIAKLPKLVNSCTIDKICIADVDENINQWKILEKIKLD